jgi:eukaryotic-like serine/threonine-protein kinase
MQAMESVDFIGRTIGHYAIVALIGSGAQGRVYRGRDEILHREVAIKVMNPDYVSESSSRPRLIREARALSSFSHANVAGVYDFVTHDHRDFMVMEFIAGATLQEVLAGGPLPSSEVVRLGSQLAWGLAAIHAANIAHCDIKPENVKVTSSGSLKIVDFGIAKRLAPTASLETPTTGVMVVGTFPYMAPEVLRGERADERSDIFSAGTVLYEMATACRAFPQRTLPDLVRAIEDGDVTAPSKINPAVPVALDRVLMIALRTAPSERYQSATELAQALEALASNHHRRENHSTRGSRWWHLTTATRKWLAPVQREAMYAWCAAGVISRWPTGLAREQLRAALESRFDATDAPGDPE